jgi:excinuclease ABC subunit A
MAVQNVDEVEGLPPAVALQQQRGAPTTRSSVGSVTTLSNLQRPQRGGTLYVLDEPTTGLHPAGVAKLMKQLDRLVDAGNTVIIVEHDMPVAAASDWIVDMGPRAGEEGGRIVVTGTPSEVVASTASRTAEYLARAVTTGR